MPDTQINILLYFKDYIQTINGEETQIIQVYKMTSQSYHHQNINNINTLKYIQPFKRVSVPSSQPNAEPRP